MGHHGFIAAIESWGSGGSELDVVTLKDGAVMMITDSAIEQTSNGAVVGGSCRTSMTPRVPPSRTQPIARACER